MNLAQCINAEWVQKGAAERQVRAVKRVLDSVPEAERYTPPARVVVAPEMVKQERPVLPSPKHVERRLRDAARRAKLSGRVNGLKPHSHALLHLFSQCPEGLLPGQVRDYVKEQVPHRSANWVYAMLTNLRTSGMLTRRGYGTQVYVITEAGRKRMVPEVASWSRDE